jgi:glutathione-regulated potassium-efflux system ancillary protein KefC/glutathione-regulated potassium-efflux system protein KefB
MTVNVGLLLERPLLLVGMALGIMAIKAAVLAPLGWFSGHGTDGTRSLAVLLCHAGEFAFVLFAVALGAGVLDAATVDLLVVAVTLSMGFTPVLFLLNENVVTPWVRGRRPPRYDEMTDADEAKVVIAGFGRVGQIVGRTLNVRRIPFTALDISAEQVDTVRRFGRKAWFGDASKLDVLRAAKLDRAEVLVLAVDDVPASIKCAELVRRQFPHVQIHARARNRFHARKLMELGVKFITREAFLSSLSMATDVL